MAYLKASLELVGTLSPDDVTGSAARALHGRRLERRCLHGPQREWDAFGAGQPEVWQCVPSRVEIVRPISNFVQHGRERGGRLQPRIEACWTSSAGFGAGVLG